MYSANKIWKLLIQFKLKYKIFSTPFLEHYTCIYIIQYCILTSRCQNPDASKLKSDWHGFTLLILIQWDRAWICFVPPHIFLTSSLDEAIHQQHIGIIRPHAQNLHLHKSPFTSFSIKNQQKIGLCPIVRVCDSDVLKITFFENCRS